MRFWVVPCVAPCYPTPAQATFATSYATSSFATVADAFARLRQDLVQHCVHEASIAQGGKEDPNAMPMGPGIGMEEWEGEGRRSWRSTSEFEYVR